ncbi:MAG: hypothetical protein EBV10_01185 [Synechococcaceae bacterium WB6_1A_059]|nr:hypothetical protein [Synechococcaceae bacterium WB6_1A_059]
MLISNGVSISLGTELRSSELGFFIEYTSITFVRTINGSFQPISVYGGTNNYSFSISPSLPANLVLNTSTGVISGSAVNTQSTATYTLTVTDGVKTTSTQFSLSVAQLIPLSLTANTTTVVLLRNVATSFRPYTPSGGLGEYSILIAPPLPANLVVNSASGFISGTPINAQNTITYVMTLTQTGFTSTSGVFTIDIDNALSFTNNYPTLNLLARVNTSTSLQPIVATGGSGNYFYSITPSLPGYFTLNTSTGIFSGIPNSTLSNTAYSIGLTDGTQSTSTTFTLRVDNTLTLQVIESTFYRTINSSTSITVANAVGGNSSQYQWTLTPHPGGLPNGLSFISTSGAITGTPVSTSTARIHQISVSDGLQSSSTNFSLLVASTLTFASTATIDLYYRYFDIVDYSAANLQVVGGLQSPLEIEYLMVGGGGGGGRDIGGGGGAGGLVTGRFTVTNNLTAFGSNPIPVNIEIGNGGVGSFATSNRGSNGTTSSITATITQNTFNIQALGGGGGASRSSPTGALGGSGGGGALSVGAGLGTAGQGSAGAPGAGGGFGGSYGGGGGGAGGAGSGSNGGIGLLYSEWAIATNSGENGYFAGGGAGGNFGDTNVGTGGLGGGQNATLDSAPDPNTPLTNKPGTGGGGAGQSSSGGGSGGAGNSGIVLLRYIGPARALGGQITTYQGYTYHKFTNTSTTPFLFTVTQWTPSVLQPLPNGISLSPSTVPSLQGSIVGTALTTQTSSTYVYSQSDGYQSVYKNFTIEVRPQGYGSFWFPVNASITYAIYRREDDQRSFFFPTSPTSYYSSGTQRAVYDSIGTNDFTIEANVYLTAYPSAGSLRGILGKGDIGPSGWVFGANGSSGAIGVYGSSPTFLSRASTSVMTLNTWYYVAVVRTSGTVRFYIDGVDAGGSNTWPHPLTNTFPIRLGSFPASGGHQPWQGYIGDVRWSNIARTITTSGPRTLSWDSNTILLTGNTATVAYTVDGTTWNGWIATGSPSVDALSGNNSLNFGPSDFTVECWIYREALGTMGIYNHGLNNSISEGFNVIIDATNFNRLRLNIGNFLFQYGSTTLNTGTWYHIVVQRKYGAHWRTFVNGSLDVENTDPFYTTWNIKLNNNYENRIGYNKSGGFIVSGFRGYISNFRISSIARYTTSSFPTPTAPFVWDTSTLLLTANVGGVKYTLNGTTYLNWLTVGAGATNPATTISQF